MSGPNGGAALRSICSLSPVLPILPGDLVTFSGISSIMGYQSSDCYTVLPIDDQFLLMDCSILNKLLSICSRILIISLLNLSKYRSW